MSAPTPSAGAATRSADRGAFRGRTAFIFAAIGSAVGLGNIWRFPAVAYDNGGGAFILPYLVALLTAGIPLLFLDYAIGHRWRGSAPAAWRRFRRWTEFIGWWQVLIALIIALYYALILAWATNYTIFSLDQRWDSHPDGAAGFFGEYTQALGGADVAVSFDYVPAVLISMLVVWIAVIVVMALGVQKGISASAVVFIPLLVVMFIILVVRSLFLPGAIDGLDAFFRPNWAALADPGVWIAAYGQIFFSLSVAFGIMLTYSSYLKKKTDLTGSGLVVGFANSSFEILAGIGVFAALGFMASASGVAVGDVATNGIGLAFIAFPTIINEAPGGVVIGVLFFVSLLLAGVTSLISIVEVIIGAVRDKVGISRLAATFVVGVPIAVISVLMFATTGGLYVLDTMDAFVNSFGIIAVAAIMMLAVTYVFRKLPVLREHLDARSSVKLKGWWPALVAVVVPILLLVMLWQALRDKLAAPYEGYPADLLNVFGWGMVIALPLIAIVLSFIPWRKDVSLEDPTTVEVDGGEQA